MDVKMATAINEGHLLASGLIKQDKKLFYF